MKGNDDSDEFDPNSEIKTWVIFGIVTIFVYTGAAAFVYTIVF